MIGYITANFERYDYRFALQVRKSARASARDPEVTSTQSIFISVSPNIIEIRSSRRCDDDVIGNLMRIVAHFVTSCSSI